MEKLGQPRSKSCPRNLTPRLHHPVGPLSFRHVRMLMLGRCSCAIPTNSRTNNLLRLPPHFRASSGGLEKTGGTPNPATPATKVDLSSKKVQHSQNADHAVTYCTAAPHTRSRV